MTNYYFNLLKLAGVACSFLFFAGAAMDEALVTISSDNGKILRVGTEKNKIPLKNLKPKYDENNQLCALGEIPVFWAPENVGTNRRYILFNEEGAMYYSIKEGKVTPNPHYYLYHSDQKFLQQQDFRGKFEIKSLKLDEPKDANIKIQAIKKNAAATTIQRFARGMLAKKEAKKNLLNALLIKASDNTASEILCDDRNLIIYYKTIQKLQRSYFLKEEDIFYGAAKMLAESQKLSPILLRTIFSLKDEVDKCLLNQNISLNDWNAIEVQYTMFIAAAINYFEKNKSLLPLAELGKRCKGSHSYERFVQKVLLSCAFKELYLINEDDMSNVNTCNSVKSALLGFTEETIKTIVELMKNTKRKAAEDEIGKLFGINFKFNFRSNEDKAYKYKQEEKPKAGRFIALSPEVIQVIRCLKNTESKLVSPMYVYGDSDMAERIAYEIARSRLGLNCGSTFIGEYTIIGPSGGTAVLACMYSCAKGVPLPNDLGITGELDIDGRIHLVGGIAEKMDILFRYGFKQVILPEGNRECFKKWRSRNPHKNLKVSFVENVDEFLRLLEIRMGIRKRG